MGFMPGKGTVDAMFVVVIEKHEKVGKKLYFFFIDLEQGSATYSL